MNNSLAPTSIPAASGCSTGKSSVFFLRLVAMPSFRFSAGRTPRARKKANSQSRSPPMATSSQNCTRPWTHACVRASVSEHQCWRGLWLSSDRPLHLASAPGSLSLCLAQASCMLMWNYQGGTITSDAGGLLLKRVEQRTRIVARFAACFTDYRKADRIEHPLADLVAQRVYGLALGYEDLNDHDQLRCDPMLAVLLGKQDPQGQQRRRSQDRGKPLAGKSTLNRLQLTAPDYDPEDAATRSAPQKMLQSPDNI